MTRKSQTKAQPEVAEVPEVTSEVTPYISERTKAEMALGAELSKRAAETAAKAVVEAKEAE